MSRKHSLLLLCLEARVACDYAHKCINEAKHRSSFKYLKGIEVRTHLFDVSGMLDLASPLGVWMLDGFDTNPHQTKHTA